MKSMSKINSYVFFDTETTGLPFQERNQTKIIEFSFVAVLRKDIELTELGDTPPVSKLTFVFNPKRPIHPKATQITGLSNTLLQHAPLFKDKIKCIVSFLEDLPKPVCLVAHNGNRFDYKILLAEFNDANATLPADLLCVDSLTGFQKILKGKSINYASLLKEKLPTSTEDDILTDDEDNWPEFDVSKEDWDEIDDICTSLSDMSCESIESETKEEIARDARNKGIKKVFNKTKVSNIEKENFRLTTLYKRLVNKEERNAHRAEEDCLMLIECVVALKNYFLPWADEACKMLTEIKPLQRY